MHDLEARARVAEYMGWTPHPTAPGWWADLNDEFRQLLFEDTKQGWWEFGQLVAAWQRDAALTTFDSIISIAINSRVVHVALLTSHPRLETYEGTAASLPEAAYLATVKMLEARDE